MNEPDTFWMWLFGGVATVISWILRRHVHTMDEHESRIATLERVKVDDDRLEQTITRIETKIDGIHRRIDEVVRDR